MTQDQRFSLMCSNIKLLFDQEPGSKNQFAKLHFITPSTVTRWCSGSIKSFDIRNLYAISRYFNKPVDWFFEVHEPAKTTKHVALQRAYATEQA